MGALDCYKTEYQAIEGYRKLSEIKFTFIKHSQNSPLPLTILISDVNIRNWKLQISNDGADEGSQPWFILKIKEKDTWAHIRYSWSYRNMHAYVYIRIQRGIWKASP